MEIWIKQNKDAIQLPILPPPFDVVIGNGHQTVNVQTKGEVSILGKKGLKSFDLPSFFPAQDYPFAAYPKDREPHDYIDKINGWLENPVQVTITDTDINEEYLITSFTYGEPDGSGDVSFTLSFQEYRKPTYTKPKKELPSKPPATIDKKPVTRPPSKPKQKTYVVKDGDCLWNIAKKFYGSGSKESKIYNANKSVIESAARKHGFTSSSNKGVPGWWIFPGTKLVIPQ